MPGKTQGRSLGPGKMRDMQLLAQTTTTSPNYDQAAGLAALLGGGTFLLIGLISIVIIVAIYYMIIKKTGYNPLLCLLIFIPFVGGLIIVIMLAFTEWPIQRELRELQARMGGGGYAPPPYAPGPSAGGPITPA